MIQQQLVEQIRRKFLDRLEPEIRGTLNEIQKKFCKSTRILEGYFTAFSTTATDIYYDLDSLVVEVKQVWLAGTDLKTLQGVYGNVVSNTGGQGWWIRDDQIGIGYLDSSGERFLGSVQAVTYYGVTMAADFTTNLNDESEIPSDYHRALLAGVLEQYHSDRGEPTKDDLRWTLYWQGEYTKYERRAKLEANARKDGTPHVVAPGQY